MDDRALIDALAIGRRVCRREIRCTKDQPPASLGDVSKEWIERAAEQSEHPQLFHLNDDQAEALTLGPDPETAHGAGFVSAAESAQRPAKFTTNLVAESVDMVRMIQRRDQDAPLKSLRMRVRDATHTPP